jgi:5-methylcytosine-specific restriction endonuclease McrA
MVAAIVALAVSPTIVAGGQSREGRRSEPRDQAAAQRKSANPPARAARSSAARRQFQQLHPCPVTGKTTGACPGYVVDHIVPLKRGGTDSPENMQ